MILGSGAAQHDIVGNAMPIYWSERDGNGVIASRGARMQR
jgi:hypothetical protein